jgi:glutamate N-acetyltransferase / amino-acid N-acetyltransferase
VTGVTAPLGFRAAGVACGIKPQGPDLALVVADAECAAAAVFTRNLVRAAPVVVSEEHLARGQARAIVANAGCANAATGEQGICDAQAMAAATAARLGCRPEDVVVASTGVIGVPLPMDKVLDGIDRAHRALSKDGGSDAAAAILTTDTRRKEAFSEIVLGGHPVRFAGMAKGSGMIAPNMATLLAFLTTDVAIDPPLLRLALQEAVDASFNRVTVDGDTSTNDMAVVLASGASSGEPIHAEGEPYDRVRAELRKVCLELAQMIVRDGEGATRVAEVRVEGAATSRDADRIARTVAESPLVKTALCGGDPNWGRVLAAVGRAGVALDAQRVDVHLGDVWVAQAGRARTYDEAKAKDALLQDPVRIRVVLGEGGQAGVVWTCDLTHGYVDINAHYRS